MVGQKRNGRELAWRTEDSTSERSRRWTAGCQTGKEYRVGVCGAVGDDCRLPLPGQRRRHVGGSSGSTLDVLAAYLLNKKKPPVDPPTLDLVLRAVAMLRIFRPPEFALLVRHAHRLLISSCRNNYLGCCQNSSVVTRGPVADRSEHRFR